MVYGSTLYPDLSLLRSEAVLIQREGNGRGKKIERELRRGTHYLQHCRWPLQHSAKAGTPPSPATCESFGQQACAWWEKEQLHEGQRAASCGDSPQEPLWHMILEWDTMNTGGRGNHASCSSRSKVKTVNYQPASHKNVIKSTQGGPLHTSFRLGQYANTEEIRFSA